MANVADTQAQTLLGRSITERLKQLRISRREFVKRTGLSRQTLHNVEREGYTDLWASTFRALDSGLGWPPGTAEKLSKGDESALDEIERDDANISMIRESLYSRIESMGVLELDALIRILETDLFGGQLKSHAEQASMMDRAILALNRLKQGDGGKPIAG